MESTDADLATYAGRCPKALFNNTVVANGQAIGRVAKETDDLIVVFGDSDNSRFDVPKSKLALTGSSVVINEPLEQYAVDKDAPLPEGRPQTVGQGDSPKGRRNPLSRLSHEGIQGHRRQKKGSGT